MDLDNFTNKQKTAFVGMNSQGKTYALETIKKKYKDEVIFIANETKANETLKNSTDSSPLVSWLERLLDLSALKTLIDNQINSVNFDDINQLNNINVGLKNSTVNYKGLISADITTNSNQWHSPGSGETFYGQLMLIEKIISSGAENPIKYLLIDEPESFLHPSLYINMCYLLKRLSKMVKVIIATHSPNILNHFIDDLDEIIIVNNGKYTRLNNTVFYSNLINDNKKIYSLDNGYTTTKAALSHFHEYFDIFIKPIILNSVFSKIVVIGEGIGEKILFDCIQNEYDNDLYLSSVSFVTLYGKDFIPLVISILSSMGLKTLVVFDEDLNSKDEINIAINDVIKNLSNKMICFNEDIETELDIKKNKSKTFKSIYVPSVIKNLYVDRDVKLLNLIQRIRDEIYELLEIKED